ncbi:MAG TPA: hypothetical protein VNG35_05930 [Gemmatimonadales bacterium]|nr:hypothetical protein [Gemmatimonadales bacterium]
MRALWLALSLAAATTLAAQDPADSGVAGDSAHLENLRQEVLGRYRARAHELLGLTPDQAVKFDSAQSRAWAQRKQYMMDRRRINMALQEQMRPGVAANSDSVSKLLDARRQVTQSLFKADDQEDREMAGFLNPVQRAQYQEFRQRFRERIADAVRNNRGDIMRPGGRPGMRPGVRPGMRPGGGRRPRP